MRNPIFVKLYTFVVLVLINGFISAQIDCCHYNTNNLDVFNKWDKFDETSSDTNQTNKSVYIEGGGSFYRIKGDIILNYFLATNWKRNSATRWNNEISVYIHNFNPFIVANPFRFRINALNYGKGYEFVGRRFFLKPSIGAGVHYMTWEGVKGFQYNLGVQINPKLQYGIYFRRFRFSLSTQLIIGLSYYQFVYSNGENANPDLKFPLDSTRRIFTDFTISYKLN